MCAMLKKIIKDGCKPSYIYYKEKTIVKFIEDIEKDVDSIDLSNINKRYAESLIRGKKNDKRFLLLLIGLCKICNSISAEIKDGEISLTQEAGYFIKEKMNAAISDLPDKFKSFSSNNNGTCKESCLCPHPINKDINNFVEKIFSISFGIKSKYKIWGIIFLIGCKEFYDKKEDSIKMLECPECKKVRLPISF